MLPINSLTDSKALVGNGVVAGGGALHSWKRTIIITKKIFGMPKKYAIQKTKSRMRHVCTNLLENTYLLLFSLIDVDATTIGTTMTNETSKLHQFVPQAQRLKHRAANSQMSFHPAVCMENSLAKNCSMAAY
jgi:hypothetical protein